jgi:hypothetical protein
LNQITDTSIFGCRTYFDPQKAPTNGGYQRLAVQNAFNISPEDTDRGTKTLWLSVDGSFVTLGAGDIAEKNVIISFRDYKRMLIQHTMVANLANTTTILNLFSVGGSGVQTTDVASIPFDPLKIGTSIYYAFGCDEILAVDPSFASTPRLVVAAQQLDTSVSSVDSFPTDCAKSVSFAL